MRKITSALLIFLLAFINVYASDTSFNDVLNSTAEYLYENINEPQISATGGEWTIIGLARSKIDIPEEYFQKYYRNVCEYVKAENGVLHSRKYTEYSRVILALTAIGKDPSSVAGYNLLLPLADYKKTVFQGINGAVWALIALDSGNYIIPENPDAEIQATRAMYVDHILNLQLPDGGWVLGNASAETVSDPDITGMVLQALSKYTYRKDVNVAIQKALDCMSAMQNENGGFTSYEKDNSESCVQMITALCELGIPLDDKRFIKNSNTLLDNLMTFYNPGNGFMHDRKEGKTNLMATEQCFYALVSIKIVSEGSSLYAMKKARILTENELEGIVKRITSLNSTKITYKEWLSR